MSTLHVCVKVPAPKDALRSAYTRLGDRELWVAHCLGEDGIYVGRPKNDGGWYLSPTVKAGSMFANPYTLKEYSLQESLRLFRAYVIHRCNRASTVDEVIALLPASQRVLAMRRFAKGVEHAEVGKSLAHLKLGVVGASFRAQLKDLRGKRLGCFCAEGDPCHAKVLGEVADALTKEDKAEGSNGLEEARGVTDAREGGESHDGTTAGDSVMAPDEVEVEEQEQDDEQEGLHAALGKRKRP